MKPKSYHLSSSTFCLLFVLTLFLFWSGSKTRTNSTAQQNNTGFEKTIRAVQTPKISIKKQMNSPLSIISIDNEKTTAYSPELEVVVMNQSNHPIRAYAIRFETISGQTTAGGSSLTNANSLDTVLHPGQKKSEIIGDGASYSDPIERIIVSIDFVEMTNGFVWGPDISKSKETLTGMRAGAKAITNQLLKILKERGPLEVAGTLERDDDIIPPSGMSSVWVNGFHTGVGSIRARLKYAYNKGGIDIIESEILKPFDASQTR